MWGSSWPERGFDVTHELGVAAQPKLLKDATSVGADGLDAQEHLFADLGQGSSLDDLQHDLLFAGTSSVRTKRKPVERTTVSSWLGAGGDVASRRTHPRDAAFAVLADTVAESRQESLAATLTLPQAAHLVARLVPGARLCMLLLDGRLQRLMARLPPGDDETMLLTAMSDSNAPFAREGHFCSRFKRLRSTAAR